MLLLLREKIFHFFFFLEERKQKERIFPFIPPFPFPFFFLFLLHFFLSLNDKPYLENKKERFPFWWHAVGRVKKNKKKNVVDERERKRKKGKGKWFGK